MADLLDEALETAKKGDDGAEPKLSEPKEGNGWDGDLHRNIQNVGKNVTPFWMNQSPTMMENLMGSYPPNQKV